MLELRTLREIQKLVHDLRTPLATMQGLSSQSERMVRDPAICEYQQRITESVESMNHMTLEILCEDRKYVVETETLFRLISPYSAASERLLGMIRARITAASRRCSKAEVPASFPWTTIYVCGKRPGRHRTLYRLRRG